MQGGFLKLVAGALVIGALMMFAVLQLIGTEANKGRLAQMADQPAAPEPVIAPTSAPNPPPTPQAAPQAMPETVYEDDEWYGEDSVGQGFTPEPFDPSPKLDDLPPEDLRFDPQPEPGVGQPQIVVPDGAVAVQAPEQ
ncbi:hypothetical protein [Aurantiacibacter suaedae]|uniref:hypothetical protein n=1 Tax=Aurantiacibacter suaedae TaxID=2545755 RepID=UPI0010F98AB9|nr:hypothetical protein [Aurantiacibacter suaedae]